MSRLLPCACSISARSLGYRTRLSVPDCGIAGADRANRRLVAVVTNPRGAGFAVVTLLALVAGAVAVAAVATIQPQPDAASDRPSAAVESPGRASDPAASPGRAGSGGPALDPPVDGIAQEGPIGSDWCEAGNLSIEVAGADAATGHRRAVLRATNVGSAPCVLDGYPDIAIADALGDEVR